MRHRILAGLAALLIALVGSLSVVTYARGADQRALAGQEAIRVFVAVKEVAAGTTAGRAVEQGLIAQKLIARAGVPDDALTEVGSGYDQLVATSNIQPGELLLRARFAARGATQGTLLVPEGLVAVSVALDDPSQVGSFVVVGSKVAVFDTFNVRGPNTADPVPAGDHLQDRHEFVRATRLLLPSVEVLAVGVSTTTTSTAPSDEKSSPALGSDAATQSATTLFTLAATQSQAERLIHSSRTGTLTFALLGPDAKVAAGKGVNDHKLFEVAK
jgi:pilus assembly protein CpaB